MRKDLPVCPMYFMLQSGRGQLIDAALVKFSIRSGGLVFSVVG